MTHFVLSAILLITLFSSPASATAAASVLNRLSHHESGGTMQIFAHFDKLPEFSEHLSGKRLDISLADTTVADTLMSLDGGDTVVKNLVLPGPENTLLSFFLRYLPQDVRISKSEANTLVIELIAGNRFTSTYQELAAQLGPLTPVDISIQTKPNPLLDSDYSDDWLTFFSDFETEVNTRGPVLFQLPPFPLIGLILPEDRAASSVIDAETFELVRENHWFEAVTRIQEKLKESDSSVTLQYLALTHAELLLRLGNHEAARTQLDHLKQAFSDEQADLLARYMSALLQARNNDPYSADFQLGNLLLDLDESHPLRFQLLVLLAETSLATGKYEQMEEILLRLEAADAPEIKRRQRLLLADLLFAKGRLSGARQAYIAYQSESDSFDLKEFPYSLNGYCSALYAAQQFELSGDCYRVLASLLTDRELIGLSLFRAAMSNLKMAEDSSRLADELRYIESQFPETEAALRSRLKLSDLCYLRDAGCFAYALHSYESLAGNSRYRLISEEARFKKALLYHLSGQDSASIDLLMGLLRDVLSGPLRPHGEALLIQLLPDELARRLDDTNYIAAIALAQQNRRLFENNWLDLSLLEDLGLAYEHLGIHQEALHIFLYLLGAAGVDDRQRYYLPLTRIAHAAGNRYFVENFSSEYFYNYPEGEFFNDILFLRLDSLYADGYAGRTADLLPSPLPLRDDYRFLAAAVYFSQQKYQTAVDTLQPVRQTNLRLPDEQIYILAESLYRLGRKDESKILFSRIDQQDPFAGSASYRLAQIAYERDEKQKALKHLRDIKNNSEPALWQKFADQQIEFYQLQTGL